LPTDYKKMQEACEFQAKADEIAESRFNDMQRNRPFDSKADLARVTASLENALKARDLYTEAQPELEKTVADATARGDEKAAGDALLTIWSNFTAFCKPPLS
jgi:hypothetical protein